MEQILEWAKGEQIEVSAMERLGGGFKNIVLLIQTAEGRSLIAKSFAEVAEMENAKRAQQTLADLSDEDEAFIPQAVAWIDDQVLVSERAEGMSLRKILQGVKDDPGTMLGAMDAFQGLGLLLGSIHERTERHVTDEDAMAEDKKGVDVRWDRKRLGEYVMSAGDSSISRRPRIRRNLSVTRSRRSANRAT